MTEQQRDTLSYSIITIVSSCLLLWVIPAYTPEYPGYGVPASLLPNIAAAVMLALSLLNLGLLALKQRGSCLTQKDSTVRIHWRHLVSFLLPCALLMPAMSFLGFIPAGIVFLLIIQYNCGQRHWIPLALVSSLPVLSVYAIMRFGLGVPMP